MPTPPKPFTVLTSEKKSHRTKQELLIRKSGEDALITGKALAERPEVKKDKVAHKEFRRVNDLLKMIDKNDAIYEPIINRYCMIQSECRDLEIRRETTYQLVEMLRNEFSNTICDAKAEEKAELIFKFGKAMSDFTYATIDIDKQIQTKRKMLLDIEKENVMTIASALRSIPKKTESKKNALLEALGGD